jgi:predicted metal-dependent enzyme (double-stranded beta helix superfamily)
VTAGSPDSPGGSAAIGPVGQKVLLDNDRVRVWHVQLAPGETQPLHHHGLPYVVVAVQGATSVIHTAAGDRIDIVENTGDVIFRDPGQVHMLTNVGDTVYIGRVIELKTGAHPS